jgi:Ribbon-helix-helix protein, copG family
MPNQPRPDNPTRQVRVEDTLWAAARATAAERGETVSEVIRRALREYVGESE